PASSGGGTGGTGTASGSQPPSGGLTNTPALDLVAPRMTIAGRSATASRRGRVSIKLGCPASEPGGCKGKLKLVTASAVTAAAKKRKLIIGSARFRVAGGKSKTVSVKLTRIGRRLLTKRRSLRVTVSVAARDASGNARAVKKALRIRAPRRRPL
ncbi:MAG TPA: hypothetical protein VFD37_06715, partial [Solirubrobacterales bacterium]|nr:hypothetical protein [Solirubrobacterales bacterium]